MTFLRPTHAFDFFGRRPRTPWRWLFAALMLVGVLEWQGHAFAHQVECVAKAHCLLCAAQHQVDAPVESVAIPEPRVARLLPQSDVFHVSLPASTLDSASPRAPPAH